MNRFNNQITVKNNMQQFRIALASIYLSLALIFIIAISPFVNVNASQSLKISDGSSPGFSSLGSTISKVSNSSMSQIGALSQNNTLENSKLISAAMGPKSNLVYVITAITNDSKVSRNTISVLNTVTGNVVDRFGVGDSDKDFLNKMVFDDQANKLYAIGEHRELRNGSLYEYDSVYKIDPKSHAFSRMSLYSEQEEGKEGDLSGIALNPETNTIYVGSLYPEGGNPGLYKIDGNSFSVITKLNNTEFGISDVIFDPKSRLIYAAAKYDDVISVLNSSDVVQKDIKIRGPIKILADYARGILYSASNNGNITAINLGDNEMSTLQGLDIKDIAFNPSDGKLYLLSVISKFVKNNDGESKRDFLSKVIIIDSLSNKLNKIYQTNSRLNNLVLDPSSNKIVLFGSDPKLSNTDLYTLNSK